MEMKTVLLGLLTLVVLVAVGTAVVVVLHDPPVPPQFSPLKP
jgi:hypothetical protein